MPTIPINRQWRLTDNQYFKEHTDKLNICLHHTVGGSARSTFDWWQQNPDRIATAYIVERDGTIYEVFDPSYWAHHLGLKMAKNTLYNERTIGIELASEGALRSGQELNTKLGEDKFDVNYLYAFDIDVKPFARAKKLYHMYEDDVNGHKFFNAGIEWRDYMFFDSYDEPQIDATISLVKHLCEQFGIPKQLVPFADKLAFDPSILLNNWPGIYTHANVRADKTDLCPAWDWDFFEQSLRG